VIKGIFFDAAGVLYCRAGSTEAYAYELLKQGGLVTKLSPEDLARKTALRTQASEGRVGYAVYWDQFLLMHGVSDPERRKTLVGQITDYSNDVLPTPGVRETLAGLKRRGFVLGVVTDTMYPIEWKMRRLTKVGAAEFIDAIACSTVLGVHKPDPTMYLNAVQQTHLTPSESAFVGHATLELEGARQAGMMTVAVNYDPGANADYYCRSLLDLLNVPIFQGRE
jgi:HAD superfamily hydrolase (TIGR01509 family)